MMFKCSTVNSIHPLCFRHRTQPQKDKHSPPINLYNAAISL